MKFKNLIILIVIAAVFFANCRKKNQIYLTFDNSTGLTNESPVLINGYKIGKIKQIELLNNEKTLVTFVLTEKISIPVDSKFTIEKSSFFGDKAIMLELGESKKLISNEDTIQGVFAANPTKLEKEILDAAKKFILDADSIIKVRNNKN